MPQKALTSSTCFVVNRPPNWAPQIPRTVITQSIYSDNTFDIIIIYTYSSNDRNPRNHPRVRAIWRCMCRLIELDAYGVDDAVHEDGVDDNFIGTWSSESKRGDLHCIFYVYECISIVTHSMHCPEDQDNEGYPSCQQDVSREDVCIEDDDFAVPVTR